MKKAKLTPEYIKENYVTAEELWARLERYKQPLYRTWEECAEYTLPPIFPREGVTESERLVFPTNSTGQAAVNNLASKLLLALLPDSGAFFRLLPYEDQIKRLTKEQLVQLDEQFSSLEQGVNRLIDAQGLRIDLFSALKFLIVTGNTLLYKIKGGRFRSYSPRNYCVERDFSANVQTIVLKESVDIRVLPTAIRETILANEKREHEKDEDYEETIYTCIHLMDNGTYLAYQEVDEIIIPSTIVTYKKDVMPYIPLRWTSIGNEDYGRGIVSQFLGDFISLEGHSRAVVEYSAAASRVVFGLKPGAATRLADLKKAKNGDFIYGDLSNDVTIVKVDKNNDMAITMNMIQAIEQRIGQGFMMLQASIRDSERTTSAEVRATISELEATLGGLFSVLALELQLPLVKLLLNELEPMVLKVSNPSIVTGASAVSRERNFQNLNTLLGTISNFGPEFMAQRLKTNGYISQLAASLGIDPTLIVKTDEEVKAAEQERLAMEQQAMQQQQAAAQGQGMVPQEGGQGQSPMPQQQ